jgi:hypothetical protein
MKKLSYLLGLFLVAGILFSSCKKDEDEPQDLTPSINFKGGANYTSADVIITAGDTILVGINADENSTSGKNLTNFKMVLTTDNNPQTLVDSNFNESSFNMDYSISFPQSGETRLSAKITDKDGQSKEIAFNITVNAALPTVSTYTDIQLGSWDDNEYGSFYASTSNTVFMKNEAGNNETIIDFVFFKGVSAFNTIGAPSSTNVQNVFQLNWGVYNETIIEMAGIDAAEFDAIGATYQFPDLAGTGNEVNNLEVDHIILFKTVEGKKGYIKINNFDQKGDRMNIDVKVED